MCPVPIMIDPIGASDRRVDGWHAGTTRCPAGPDLLLCMFGASLIAARDLGLTINNQRSRKPLALQKRYQNTYTIHIVYGLYERFVVDTVLTVHRTTQIRYDESHFAIGQ